MMNGAMIAVYSKGSVDVNPSSPDPSSAYCYLAFSMFVSVLHEHVRWGAYQVACTKVKQV